MLPTPQREEIDHRTIKLLIGLIALTLATFTSYFAGGTITSISAAYYEGGWAQSILVGFLFAIAAFLLAYNGLSTREMVLSKVAAVAALGVALFPCKCGNREQIIPYVHAVSATTMFLVLAYFCYVFYRRALVKVLPSGHRQSLHLRRLRHHHRHCCSGRSIRRPVWRHAERQGAPACLLRRARSPDGLWCLVAHRQPRVAHAEPRRRTFLAAKLTQPH
jgi:hypothetical protein